MADTNENETNDVVDKLVFHNNDDNDDDDGPAYVDMSDPALQGWFSFSFSFLLFQNINNY